MDSELLGRDFVNVINELEKLEKLFKKCTNTINLQDREINCINNEIEILSERINTVKKSKYYGQLFSLSVSNSM